MRAGLSNFITDPEGSWFNAGRGFAHTFPLTLATEGVGGLYTRVLGAAELGAVEEIPGFIRYNNSEPVYYGQVRASPRFTNKNYMPDYLRGRLIEDVAVDLRSGILSPDQLPVNVFRHENGRLVSENTRTLTALSEARFTPTVIRFIDPWPELLERFDDDLILLDSPLPSPRVPITPNRSDHTILRIVSIPFP